MKVRKCKKSPLTESISSIDISTIHEHKGDDIGNIQSPLFLDDNIKLINGKKRGRKKKEKEEEKECVTINDNTEYKNGIEYNSTEIQNVNNGILNENMPNNSSFETPTSLNDLNNFKEKTENEMKREMEEEITNINDGFIVDTFKDNLKKDNLSISVASVKENSSKRNKIQIQNTLKLKLKLKLNEDVVSNSLINPVTDPMEIVLNYLKKQNRPYSLLNIADNLHGLVSKQKLGAILEKLVSVQSGDTCIQSSSSSIGVSHIKMKEYGAQKFYLVNQLFFTQKKKKECSDKNSICNSLNEEMKGESEEESEEENEEENDLTKGNEVKERWIGWQAEISRLSKLIVESENELKTTNAEIQRTLKILQTHADDMELDNTTSSLYTEIEKLEPAIESKRNKNIQMASSLYNFTVKEIIITGNVDETETKTETKKNQPIDEFTDTTDSLINEMIDPLDQLIQKRDQLRLSCSKYSKKVNSRKKTCMSLVYQLMDGLCLSKTNLFEKLGLTSEEDLLDIN